MVLDATRTWGRMNSLLCSAVGWGGGGRGRECSVGGGKGGRVTCLGTRYGAAAWRFSVLFYCVARVFKNVNYGETGEHGETESLV